MMTNELKIGAKVWYLRQESTGMTRQDQVTVLAVNPKRVKVQNTSGRNIHVKAQNLRPTN